MFSPNFEDHLIFLHYLRSKVLSRLATPEAISIQVLLLYCCQVLLYLWWITSVRLWWITPKYYLFIRKANKLQKSLINHLTFSRIWVTDTIFHNKKIYQISGWQRKDVLHVALHHFYVKETTMSLQPWKCHNAFVSFPSHA